MSQPEPNTDAAVEFLERWLPGGPWILTAISTDKKNIETETLGPDDVRAWIDRHNGHRNLYFHVNRAMRRLSKKAHKTDVASLDWLHIDIDPRPGRDIEEERARALHILENPPRGDVPPPNVIIFSGGGYQGFWKLAAPIPLNGDLEQVEDAERYNRELEMVFEADACHNADRIMRLPGTINLPDPGKLKKGRVPTLAELVKFEDESFATSRFRKAPKLQAAAAEQGGGFAPTAQVVMLGDEVRHLSSVDELDEWEVPDRIRVIIVQGRHPDEVKERDNSRSAWLFEVVCTLVRKGVPDDVIYSVITDPNFRISESVLDKGSEEQCRRYATRQIAQAKEHAINPELAQMNQRYAVIRSFGGKCRVVEEQQDPNLQGRARLVMQAFGDFTNAYLNELVKAGEDSKGNPRFETKGKWWLHHKDRRTYDRVVFSPAREVPGAYNLWRGFAVTPRPGSCEKFLAHIRDNVCSGNEEHYEYLLSWMARAVQQPNSPGEVAVVLRGGRGTGKGFFAHTFGHVFGRHYLAINDAKHLVGSFNAHLRDVIVLFANEAFYAGDKKHESTLKALITDPTIDLEAKGIDMEDSANFLHIIMASNDDWVVPAGSKERRYFVMDVGDAHQQDEDYFADISAEMEAGGYEALLHLLLNRDLSQFRVRKVPKTEALHFQKVLTQMPHEEWWYRKLHDGQLFSGTAWPATVQKSKLLEDYIRYTKDYNITRRSTPTFLGKFLARVCPGLSSFQARSGGSDKRHYFYSLPNLETAREGWVRAYGPEEWPEIHEVELADEPPEAF